jgi:hypothetical protein
VNEKKTHKQMAQELDKMNRDVTSEEADFLEEVLDTVGEGKKLKPKVAGKLEEIYEKYLVNREDAEEEDPDEEEVDDDELE